MAKRHSDKDNALVERVVRQHQKDGKIFWDSAAQDISEALERTVTPGAVEMWYRRLVARNGVTPSSRAGDKTLKRVVRWMENLVASQHRMRTLLNSKRGKRRSSARMELLKKKNRELRDRIISLTDQLKSTAPAVRFYAQTKRALAKPKVRKALITE